MVAVLLMAADLANFDPAFAKQEGAAGAVVSIEHDEAELLTQALACVIDAAPNSVNIGGFERLQRDFDKLLREFRALARGEG